jgi:hypothetical protein
LAYCGSSFRPGNLTHATFGYFFRCSATFEEGLTETKHST